MSWEERAACRGMGFDLFFPFPNENDKARAAISICDSCPVREPCLQEALSVRSTYGIWGGTREEDRNRRGRRKAS